MENMNQSIEDLILGTQPIKSDKKTLKMIALRGVVVLPEIAESFDLGREKSVQAINKAMEREEPIFLVAQKSAAVDNPEISDMYKIGTIATVKQILKLPGDNVRILVQGRARAQISEYITSEPYFEVSVKELALATGDEVKVEALVRKIKEVFTEYNKLDAKLSADLVNSVMQEEYPGRFACKVAQIIITKDYEKQRFLETLYLEKALDQVLMALIRETEILKLDKRITGRVRRQMDKNQKEYYLREQIKAIHDELGDSEDELGEYKERAKKSGMPKEVLTKVEKEINRISKMSPTSPEASVSRTYIETLIDLPWEAETVDNKDLKRAAEILDEDHYGLEKVKERILEFLAVKQLTDSNKGPILCFVGPPGVGKTSIARSIARSLDKKFVTLSLGGVRDEAEIRGHRRTYIGAIPGRIINQIKSAGTRNPVFLLDEIDKMSSDFRGDPASAMLEVLDPEQNYHFRDHYLEVPFDLSRTLFIATANTLDSIPPPLLDRMETIELSGYTMEEKTQIAKQYLVGKQSEANGVSGRVLIGEETVKRIIQRYTREAGVRNLEREIAGICRKCARRIVDEGKKAPKVFEIEPDDLPDYLGVYRYQDIEMNDRDEVGAATGLAWTAVGGVTMTIEVALIKSEKGGSVQLTGKLGEVMKESAQIALSVVKLNAEKYGIDKSMFNDYDIHIHVPEGATPKDGPSAGITLATSILSAFTGKLIRKNIAMTGELTLRGKVLAIGGLKDKALACHRSGIRNLIIPKENEKNLVDIPENIRNDLTITPVTDIEEVFKLAIID